ncbi:MAG: hypothetical protein ACJ76V_16545 [Thermoleophilaceae bacterium]
MVLAVAVVVNALSDVHGAHTVKTQKAAFRSWLAAHGELDRVGKSIVRVGSRENTVCAPLLVHHRPRKDHLKLCAVTTDGPHVRIVSVMTRHKLPSQLVPHGVTPRQ